MLSNLVLTQQWFEARETRALPSYTSLPWGRSLDLTLGYILSLFCGCWPNPFPFSHLSKGKLGVPLIPIDWMRIFLGWAWLFLLSRGLPASAFEVGALLLPWGGMRSLFLLGSRGTQSLGGPGCNSDGWSQGCRDLGKSSCLTTFRPLPSASPHPTPIPQTTSHRLRLPNTSPWFPGNSPSPRQRQAWIPSTSTWL